MILFTAINVRTTRKNESPNLASTFLGDFPNQPNTKAIIENPTCEMTRRGNWYSSGAKLINGFPSIPYSIAGKVWITSTHGRITPTTVSTVFSVFLKSLNLLFRYRKHVVRALTKAKSKYSHISCSPIRILYSIIQAY